MSLLRPGVSPLVEDAMNRADAAELESTREQIALQASRSSSSPLIQHAQARADAADPIRWHFGPEVATPPAIELAGTIRSGQVSPLVIDAMERADRERLREENERQASRGRRGRRGPIDDDSGDGRHVGGGVPGNQ